MRPDIEKLKATIRGFLNVTGYPSPEVINDILYEDIPNLVRYIEELEAVAKQLIVNVENADEEAGSGDKLVPFEVVSDLDCLVNGAT
jgi:hypothetical protein